MYISDTESFISLGTSCIVEHNFREYFNERKAWICDFNVTTLDAAINILEMHRDGTLKEALCNKNNYEPHMTSFKKIIFKNTVVDGFSLWHEESFESAIEKINHVIDSILLVKDNPIFVFSNIQYNLKWTMETAGKSVDDAYVTVEKYNKISNLVKEIFNGTAAFILRDRLADQELFKMKNVYTFKMAETDGDAANEWCLGPKDEFFKIFDAIRNKNASVEL